MAGLDIYKRRIRARSWVLITAWCFLAYLFFDDLITLLIALLGGGIIFVVGLVEPIASRKQIAIANSPLNDSAAQNAKMHAVLDVIPDPIILLGQGGNIQFANSEFKRTFGKVELGSSVMLLFRNPDLQAMVRAGLRNETPSEIEYVETTPIERWFAASIRRAMIGGTNKQLILHFRDLSETKRTDKIRSDFIANASHELRTPLASLTGFIETIAGPAREDAAARDRFLKIMQEQAERMSRLINDLLTLSRFETARGRAHFGAVSVGDVISHVSDALRPMAKQTGTQIQIDNSGLLSDETMVNGSRDELIQLFENLVENAIKYGKDNGRVEIKLSLDDARTHIIAEVNDDGPGISKEHLPRLVERFYRVDVDTSRGKQGTGLGLSIVKHIVQRHGGRLKVSSELGSGTKFIVTFPSWSEENL